jgi:predicted NUDIX family NTP pyrophosphohydrolase
VKSSQARIRWKWHGANSRKNSALPPDSPLRALGEIRQRGGKRVIAFAVEGNLDADAIASNTFEMEWPGKVGGDRAFRRSIALHGST